MTAGSSDKSEMLRTVFDAIPSLVFVVDDDVRIQDYNAASAKLLPGGREAILDIRGGQALNCLHSKDVPEGCGRGTSCKNCVIRNSVAEAVQGNSVVRRRTRMEIIQGGEKVEIFALITASPFLFKKRSLVLLVIEDISEISELRRMITICSVCKKIKDEEETWSRVESYFKKRWDVEFSHGFCPECLKSEMEEVKKLMKAI